jgi:hypothetical protein
MVLQAALVTLLSEIALEWQVSKAINKIYLL